MNIVRTVLGDIAPDQLGVTAAHEHLWCNQCLCSKGDFPARGEMMFLQDIELVVDEASRFKTAGGGAIIEVTCHGWGRDLNKLGEISRRTGLNVVATAGYYIEPCHPEFVRNASVEELTDFLVRDITVEADGSGQRAGLLKAAVSGARIEGEEKRCSIAVARAHHRTGAAITTHTSASSRFYIDGGNAGLLFLDLFDSEGVDPSRVIIGHVDENADIRQLVSIMERGAYIEFDVIGKEHWLLDTTRADLVAALVRDGHVSRLLLSGDRNRMSEMHVNKGKGYDYLLTKFVPLLTERGVSEADIAQILITNPATVFSMPSGAKG